LESYDLAGNAREWCFNESSEEVIDIFWEEAGMTRHILLMMAIVSQLWTEVLRMVSGA
jgi:hypothetical protein